MSACGARFAPVALAMIALALGADARAADPPSTRVAVLPFKNLGDDSALGWLSLGVAETMIADLRKARRDVVERDQLDHALAEIALQGTRLSEDSRAAQAGRLAGATHVVVGGFQRADDKLRITARTVVVETGVIEATAKVTGPIEDIFALQDQIVAQLLKLPDAQKRPKPKAPRKTVAAYEAYARSLSTSSDAERIEQLRSALDLDPDFHYALVDLRMLEERLKRYEKKGRAIADERLAAQMAIVLDPKAPVDDRNMQAVQMMGTLMSQFRYAALLDVATQIERADIPDGQYVHARETASYYVFLSLMMLKKNDLAVQQGERYLQTWPAGMFATSLQMQLRSMIEQAHRHEEAVKRGQRELAALELEERTYLEERKKDGKEPDPLRLRSFDFRRCSTPSQSERWAEAIDACKQFVEHYKNANDDDDLRKLGRFLTARAWAELGRFDEANAEALRLLDEQPVWAREHSVESIRNTWPKE